MSSRIDDKYRLYLTKWENAGNKLKKIMIILFIITIFIQLLLLLNIEGLPPSSTLKMEGKAIIENLFDFKEGEVILRADKIDKNHMVKIIINGVEICPFDKQFITLIVNEADIIEISGINCLDRINISVYSVSDNVSIPKVGLNYQINKNLVYLFRIKMKLR